MIIVLSGQWGSGGHNLHVRQRFRLQRRHEQLHERRNPRISPQQWTRKHNPEVFDA